MQTLKEKVFLLASVPYRDSDLIVNLLSRKSGKLSSVIYGGRKIAKEKSFSFCSGDLIEIEYQKPENRDFIKILNSSETRLLNADRFSYDRFIFHTYFIEIISKISKPELPALELYDLLTEYEKTGWIEENPFSFICWLIWKLIYSGGYQIDTSACECCGKESWQEREQGDVAFRKETYVLNLDSGKLICSSCYIGTGNGSGSLSGGMIKILWLFETTLKFEKDFCQFPKPLTLQLIKTLDRYLVKSFDIQPKSQELFLGFLQKSTDANL